MVNLHLRPRINIISESVSCVQLHFTSILSTKIFKRNIENISTKYSYINKQNTSSLRVAYLLSSLVTNIEVRITYVYFEVIYGKIVYIIA